MPLEQPPRVAAPLLRALLLAMPLALPVALSPTSAASLNLSTLTPVLTYPDPATPDTPTRGIVEIDR